MISRRIVKAVPFMMENTYRVAMHPDASLVEARRAHIKGTWAENAARVSDSPAAGTHSEGRSDMDEVDLADGPYKFIGDSEGSTQVGRDAEAAQCHELRRLSAYESSSFCACGH